MVLCDVVFTEVLHDLQQKHTSDRRSFWFLLNVQYQFIGESPSDEGSEGWGLSPLM